MRSTPLRKDGQQPPPISEPVTQTAPAANDGIIDLTERLKKRTEPVTATPTFTEPAKPATEEKPDTTQGGPASAEFDEKKFTEFKENAVKAVEGFMADPKQFSGILVKLANMLRMFIYPGLYRVILLEGDERKDIKPLLRKIATAKKANEKDFKLNDYEKELLAKWEGYLKLKKGISYTEEEMKLLSDVLARHVKDMPIMQWLERHDWILVLIFIEAQRFVPVVGTRMGNSMADFTMNEV